MALIRARNRVLTRSEIGVQVTYWRRRSLDTTLPLDERRLALDYLNWLLDHWAEAKP